MASTANRASAPAGWFESLARSKAQIAAGEAVPLVPVLDRLRAAADRLDGEQDDLRQDSTAQTSGQ